jgi:hypothetical protein
MKQIIRNIPLIGKIAGRIYRAERGVRDLFSDSRQYWEQRYKAGGNSGDGSYGQLAIFKAETLNSFVLGNDVKLVIEYGCGDGHQVSLSCYPSYIGFDVSDAVVSICRERFRSDETKVFKLVEEYKGEIADLTLSLDVIYHLLEEQVFRDYMQRLFDSSSRFVIIYSSNTDENHEDQASHVKHRKFTGWVLTERPEWQLLRHIPNKYPFAGDTRKGSHSDFYIFEKRMLVAAENIPKS